MSATSNMPQRIGAALQRHPLAYSAAATAVKLVGLMRRGRQVDAYLGGTEQRYLRIGSGRHTDPGWLAVDLVPVARGVVFMDATKPMPLPTGGFEAVQCEHVIEHVSYDDGQKMLRESHRVLRPGGVLRIATPNLDLVRRLLTPGDPDPRLAAYVEWSNRTFGTTAERRDLLNPAFTANRLVRRWGHVFLYDERTLRGALEATGFSEIIRVRPGESAHEALRGVDRHHEEIGVDANDLETLAFEAIAA